MRSEDCVLKWNGSCDVIPDEEEALVDDKLLETLVGDGRLPSEVDACVIFVVTLKMSVDFVDIGSDEEAEPVLVVVVFAVADVD